MPDLGWMRAQQPPAFIYILSMPSHLVTILIPVKRRRKRREPQVNPFSKRPPQLSQVQRRGIEWGAVGIMDDLHTPQSPFGPTDTFTFRVILPSVSDGMLKGFSKESLGPLCCTSAPLIRPWSICSQAWRSYNCYDLGQGWAADMSIGGWPR